MIYKNNLELTARYDGKQANTAVYHAPQLDWDAISSCFGSGYWINNRPWSNTDSWRNS